MAQSIQLVIPGWPEGPGPESIRTIVVAGGSAGWAPDFCASASSRAGCGGTSGGRVPVVTPSAGAGGFFSSPGVDCSGWVDCASCCGSRPRSSASDRPAMTSPVVTKAAASRKSQVAPRLLLSADISFTANWFAISTADETHCSPGTLRQTARADVTAPPFRHRRLRWRKRAARPWHSRRALPPLRCPSGGPEFPRRPRAVSSARCRRRSRRP